jgi:predicted anti-sigma-YlaC factor YlaD
MAVGLLVSSSGLGLWGHVMTCKTAIGTICNYLEGNLSAHGVMALRRHLDECKDCRLVLDAARRTLEIDFDRLEAIAPPNVPVA